MTTERNTPIYVIEARWVGVGGRVIIDWHATPIPGEYFSGVDCDAFREAEDKYRRWWVDVSMYNDKRREHPRMLELRVAQYQRIPKKRYRRLPGARHG